MRSTALGLATAATLLLVPAAASGATGGAAPGEVPAATGVVDDGAKPVVAGTRTKFIGGRAYAPADAPRAVKRAVWAGNRIHGKPYIYGGGHAGWAVARGYDCSGAVSFLTRAMSTKLLASPVDANGFMQFRRGKGRWVTYYVKPGSHVYVKVAGLRFDTSGPGPEGPRWRTRPRYSTAGFIAYHPAGL